MKTHQEIYHSLHRLIPGLESIPIQKDPYILEKDGEVPLCVHVSERTPDFTIVNLCQYPRAENGELIPAPDIEIAISHASKEAKPIVCIDSKEGRVELDDQFRKENPQQAQRLDKSVFQWLSSLERRGFKPLEPIQRPGRD